MFEGCTSLIEAPKLPAEKLVFCCYESMFKGCISLQQVTMMATGFIIDYCNEPDVNVNNTWIINTAITDWLDDTASSGTFYKNKQSKWKNEDVIPPNWEVKEIEADQIINLP